MIELSTERVEQIIHEETQKTEELTTILRAIYTRYMRLYEKYFADIDALNDDEIAKLKKYHKETMSLVKYYYLDIPLDIISALELFESESSSKLLGGCWRKYLYDDYYEFKDENDNSNKSEEYIKKEFAAKQLKVFYDHMDVVFREGFGTDSKTAEKLTSNLSGFLFNE